MDRDDPNSLIAVRFIECVMKAYCTMNVMNGGYFEKMKTFVGQSLVMKHACLRQS